MIEDNGRSIIPRDDASNGSNGAGNLHGHLPLLQRFPDAVFTLREPHLYDYLLILRKHLWMILSFMLAVTTIVSIYTFRMRPVYIATARIQIDPDNQNILPFRPSDASSYIMDQESYIETESKILTSETLALQTIRSAGLAGNSEFSPGGRVSDAVATGSLANQSRPPELSAFLGSLTVKRVPNSLLLDISFESTDPRLAARTLNSHLDNFIEHNFRSRYEATTQASTWLADQLNELKIKVEKSEEARLGYERENSIWTLDDKQSITTQRLADINKDLTEAQSDRMRKEALFQMASSGNFAVIPEAQTNLVLQDLLHNRATAEAEYSAALNQYGPNFPRVQRLSAQLKEIEKLIDREGKNVVDRVENAYRTARQRELLLSKSLDAQKAEANQMAQRLVQYNILKREAEANKQLYDGLLTKLKEAGISAGLRSSNIRVVDPAMIPSFPARPAKSRNILMAILVGLVGGIGLALLREYLDNTVKTPEDVEHLVRLPSLAVVPAFEGTSANGRGMRFLKDSAKSNGHKPHIELVSHHLPKSLTSEAFRALRTALLLSQAEHPPQVLLVTSALPREGKTTAAANLAVTLAQLGDKTVLVDADLRKPGVGRVLDLLDGKYAGLSSFLAGVSSLDLVCVQHPEVENLTAIPTGPLPPNPADLLCSPRMALAIAELRKKYKFIVIDTPPVMAVTDAVILSVLVDGVVLVARSGETPKEALSRTHELLTNVKSRILGVVLNAVDSSAPDYYYSYRYYPYSYGYGLDSSTNSIVPGDDLAAAHLRSRSREDDGDSLSL
ncbi:MAG: polysaccharide biosynthesis tyrosine autokinase [Acidobacteriia bacterium]|nr:polysaccharide biosynthesis tyrosine autokinase [Terriglobia bacterium]